MYEFVVSAPGKLFLCGEYAVLEGARSVITSVDRRVVAKTTRQNMSQSTLLRTTRDAVQVFLEERAGKPVGKLPNVDIDSSGFSSNRKKLGIGSSAAVAAATAGVLFQWAGLEINDHKDELYQVAAAAHKAYQEGKGSGADVATSVFGGTVVFQRDVAPAVAPPAALEKVFVWTGSSASTTSLVEQVHRLRDGNPAAYDRVMTPLVELANALADHYLAGNIEEIVALSGRYGDAMGALGNAASASIITNELQAVADLARECGGAAKPSGAGGGDMGVAFFTARDNADAFRKKCRARNIETMDFHTHVDGVKSVG